MYTRANDEPLESQQYISLVIFLINLIKNLSIFKISLFSQIIYENPPV